MCGCVCVCVLLYLYLCMCVCACVCVWFRPWSPLGPVPLACRGPGSVVCVCVGVCVFLVLLSFSRVVLCLSSVGPSSVRVSVFVCWCVSPSVKPHIYRVYFFVLFLNHTFVEIHVLNHVFEVVISLHIHDTHNVFVHHFHYTHIISLVLYMCLYITFIYIIDTLRNPRIQVVFTPFFSFSSAAFSSGTSRCPRSGRQSPLATVNLFAAWPKRYQQSRARSAAL